MNNVIIQEYHSKIPMLSKALAPGGKNCQTIKMNYQRTARKPFGFWFPVKLDEFGTNHDMLIVSVLKTQSLKMTNFQNIKVTESDILYQGSE